MTARKTTYYHWFCTTCPTQLQSGYHRNHRRWIIDYKMSNSDTQLLSGYQQNHRLQSVGYNTSHTHSYSLATSETTDHKELATTRPTHTVTVWLPVKSQTTKCWLQRIPHTQLQSGYQQNHRPQSVGYNTSHTHSYSLATSEITDHKGLPTTCPT